MVRTAGPEPAPQCGTRRVRPGLRAGGPGAAALSNGRLKRVLDDWHPLYYPGRGQPTQSRLREYQRQGEGIENRPAFKEAFQRRRCLVPVDNFYEWKKTPTGKQTYAVALAYRG